jgi:hypothetical protein
MNDFDEQKPGEDVLAQLMMPNPPTSFQRRYGQSKLRTVTGGEPAFWGPLQRMMFGDNLPLYGLPPDVVKLLMHGQMGQTQEIADEFQR